MQHTSALPAAAAETYTAHSTASPAVQSNEVYPTPCTTVPSISFAAASDKRYSLGLTHVRHALIQFVLLAAAPVVAARQDAEVQFLYNQGSPETCLRGSVKPEWHAELKERLPEVASLWHEHGPRMAQQVQKITGRPFVPTPKVALTLCGTPSNSFLGPTVNMRYALRSFASSPVPMRYKIDTVFHEMLHEFVSRAVPRETPLLSSYSAESSCVRNHLHLLALQKAVLTAIDEPAALEKVVAIDSLLPSGCYKRAWEIVNTTGVYERLITELAQ